MNMLTILTYSFTLWFGAYLIRRNPHRISMVLGGLGLISFALSLAILYLADPSAAFTRLSPLLPSAFWGAAALSLLATDISARLRADWIIVLVIASITTALLVVQGDDPLWLDLLGAEMLTTSAYGISVIARILRRDFPTTRVRMLFTASILFFLSSGVVLIPPEFLATDLALAAVGFDLLLLGFGIVALDAYEEGETLLPDILRSLGSTALLVMILGGQVAVIMSFEENETPLLYDLLLATITSAILIQVFYSDLQRALDSAIFWQMPGLRSERDQFRAISDALPRQFNHDLTTLDDDEFTRITRRALSAMGSLNRLASNPLIHLPGIEADNTLERANELKRILAESIEHLKPHDKGDFGTSDEWRHFNALYYPYVAGLKPYSRRQHTDDLQTHEREALDWFRAYVPERTLYNWQNDAAALIAQHLRENWQ